ncbi:MAG: PIN domain-containing protein [Paracoccaceae bacterium]
MTAPADADAFFDTNVLLYLLSGDTAKAERAETLLTGGGLISVQVLNEFASVARRKAGLDWAEIADLTGTFRQTLKVLPLTEAMHTRGLVLAGEVGFSFYDCLIVAAAETAGAGVLWSEDMQDGRRIGQLTIRNPFARGADG